jgi:hypothetical protein
MKDFLKWFKYNKIRTTSILAITILFLLIISGEIHDDFILFAIPLPFILVPEIIKYGKMAIEYYKAL